VDKLDIPVNMVNVVPGARSLYRTVLCGTMHAQTEVQRKSWWFHIVRGTDLNPGFWWMRCCTAALVVLVMVWVVVLLNLMLSLALLRPVLGLLKMLVWLSH